MSRKLAPPRVGTREYRNAIMNARLLEAAAILNAHNAGRVPEIVPVLL